MAKTPLFTVFRAFHVFLKLQKQCKYQHFLRSTCQKCCNLQCFFALLSKTLVFAVFCASRVQKVLVFTAFSAFLHGSRKRRLKRKNAVIYNILCLSKSWKSSEKCRQNERHFFPILGTLKNGGGAGCSWRRLWATRIPAKKLSPTLLKDFWCFSGPGVGGSAVWGAPHLRALVALGRS